MAGLENSGAWKALVEAYYDKIFSFAFYMLGTRDEAADAAQDVFLKACTARAHLRDPEALKGWLYAIARNVCLDRKRWWKRWRFTSEIPETVGRESATPLQLDLRRAITKLPARQLEVFVLRHWHGFSTAETAKLLGINEGSVKSHLSRAIQRLKKELDADDNHRTASGVLTEKSV